ncbi:hypothetical protein BGW36DRAFT_207431 [Talaromyces proteolyticus]|uniref:Uncharacterized protein n=1 Tax=Talaromyces proteolyticus TaxID=1131652 RepID=A0AAD4KM96_9EURO|nr:uncharacterized protein BGW36DRAFT_207431 [Talaromyces proteolyticus]KAH8693575.1 hypothetical protein BGW36DRAFT_207431 [Talaromyces proteolyticus]
METVSSFTQSMHRDGRKKRDYGPQGDGSSTLYRGIGMIPPSPSALPQFSGTAESADLLLLAPLTTIHVGRAAIEYLSVNILQFVLPSYEKHASYVSHVPCRWGQEVALDHAVGCVVAAFHALHIRDNTQSLSKHKPLSLYTRALQFLQQALKDPKRSLSAETLCATELLCLFEYLTKDIDKAWIQHARGAARLIEHRGPRMFTTEFEKSLLIGQMGIITTEAFFDNKHCFLEQGAWMYALRSSISPNEQFSDRSERVVSLYENMIFLPGLLKDCSTIIMSPDEHNGALHEALVHKVDMRRRSLLSWYRKWGRGLPPPDDIENERFSWTADEISLWPEILVTHQACMLMCNRILVALDRTRGHILEPESQEIATQIMTIRHAPRTNIRAGSMMASLSVAQAVLATASDWDMDMAEVPLPLKYEAHKKRVLISPEKLSFWTGLIGIQIR